MFRVSITNCYPTKRQTFQTTQDHHPNNVKHSGYRISYQKGLSRLKQFYHKVICHHWLYVVFSYAYVITCLYWIAYYKSNYFSLTLYWGLRFDYYIIVGKNHLHKEHVPTSIVVAIVIKSSCARVFP